MDFVLEVKLFPLLFKFFDDALFCEIAIDCVDVLNKWTFTSSRKL